MKTVTLVHPVHGEGIFMENNLPADTEWAPLGAEQPKQDAAPPSVDELRGIAEKLGIKIDRRWGEKRLIEEIQQAE